MMQQIDILVEEPSMEEALKHLLPRIGLNLKLVGIRPFRGKSNLLKKLPFRLKGYQKQIHSGKMKGVVVLVDCDKEDCKDLKRQLEKMAEDAGLTTSTHRDKQGCFMVLNRVVIQELESWFLGDREAIHKAFPGYRGKQKPPGIFLNPDNGGSYEKLVRYLKKDDRYKNKIFPKIDTARRIAPYLDINKNYSKSFQVFISGIKAMMVSLQSVHKEPDGRNLKDFSFTSPEIKII